MNATVTLVAVIDCHASHNVRLENVNPEEKGYIKRFLKAHGYQVVERKADPTCDNCANMAIRQDSNGENHRRCELFGQAIPDNEQSPTCDYHSAVMKFQSLFSGKQTRQNTLRERRLS